MLDQVLKYNRKNQRIAFWLFTKRTYADCGGSSTKKGLVVGAYDGCSPGELKLTPTALKIDEETGGKLRALLKGDMTIKKGTAQVYSNIHPELYSIAVAGLGQEGIGLTESENLDECKENIRWAAGVGARALHETGLGTIFVEGFTNTESAAEGAILGTWQYQELKNRDHQYINAKIEMFEDQDREGWARGALRADCQNVARKLEETPANLMTPILFSQHALDLLCACGIQVEVRDRDWLEQKKFNAFLTLAKGSCEEPLLLEIGYCGGQPDDKPIVFIGKGITFDSGGLCLKKCEGMSEYRGDLAGAAVIVGVLKCIASMALPINVRALIPLCENQPGGMAIKPGDVVVGLNGKTIVVEDTDNEGRIIMVDPLVYSNTLYPCMVTSIATLTPGVRWGLGSGCSAVFTNSNPIWREINRAGAETGDRVWRFPFWKYYTKKITSYTGVDVHNVGKGTGAAPCLGAAFIREFAPPGIDLMHLDITGTGLLSTGYGHPYLRKGLMTGRPVRTIAQFLYQIACPHDRGDEC
ncbi:cytosol aminopeptidase-like [Cimex lectularius]|uniref:Cytosol aminopeptidase n=1 Tax=Cimex lectularius TaxID=79782 RepID=A0A8I6RD41_CIMLE|nr:cytosol aminopeptidase-like [Cimex lectularius]